MRNYIRFVAYLLRACGQFVDVMKKKRAIHEDVINLVHKKRSSDHVEKVIFLYAK